MKRIVHLVTLLVCLPAADAAAQSLAASGHFASAQWSEFDGNDYGVGGRLTWTPSSTIGVDADFTWYPSDFPPDTRAPFSGSRVEGLFGVTAGPRINRIRPFLKAAAGFLAVGDTPEALVCIAIFPPPLACLMATGDTRPAYELGGGIEVNTSGSTFFRADITDRILKYPGPTIDSDFEVRDESFYGHGLRLTVGGGIRF